MAGGNDNIIIDLIKELKENISYLMKISNQNEKIIRLLQEQKDSINSLKNNNSIQQVPLKKHPSCWIDVSDVNYRRLNIFIFMTKINTTLIWHVVKCYSEHNHKIIV